MLKTIRQHVSTALGGHFVENHQQKVQKCEKHGTEQTVTGIPVHSMRAEARKGASRGSVSAGNVSRGQLKLLLALRLSANDHRSTSNVDLGLIS